MNIQQQKDIADSLIQKLEAVDPHVILAGGAPRNWFFDKPANDLDLYVYLPKSTIDNDKARWKALGLELTLLDPTEKFGNNGLTAKEQVAVICASTPWEGTTSDFDNIKLTDRDTYNSMEHLTRVWEGEYKGMAYQVMVMATPTFQSVIPHFGTSVCMAWYKYQCHYTLEFLLSMHLQIIFKKADYTAKTAHVEKMIEYFPEFGVLDYSDFKGVLHLWAKDNTYTENCTYSKNFTNGWLCGRELKKLLREEGRIL